MLSKQIEYFSFLVIEQWQANQKAPILVIFEFSGIIWSLMSYDLWITIIFIFFWLLSYVCFKKIQKYQHWYQTS